MDIITKIKTAFSKIKVDMEQLGERVEKLEKKKHLSNNDVKTLIEKEIVEITKKQLKNTDVEKIVNKEFSKIEKKFQTDLKKKDKIISDLEKRLKKLEPKPVSKEVKEKKEEKNTFDEYI